MFFADWAAQFARVAVTVFDIVRANTAQSAQFAVPKTQVSLLAVAVANIAIVLRQQATIALTTGATLTNGRHLHAVHAALFLNSASIQNVILGVVVT